MGVWDKVSGGGKIGKEGERMNKEEMAEKWRCLSEEMIEGMGEWRKEKPKASLREIEEEVDRRLSKVRAQMIMDMAEQSASRDWQGQTRGAVCPKCGEELKRKGKKKRKLETQGGQTIELEREYGVCPKCGVGIFPPG